MSDIFREVDEEVRQDRALALWNKHQNLILAVAAIIVIAAGGYRFWQGQQVKAAEAANEKFQAAMALSRDDKPAEAHAAFEAIAKDAPKGYAMLARMRAAAELGATDKPGAVKAFDALANDNTLDPLMRDDARLRAALLRVDGADRKEMEQRLQTLAAGGAAFRSTARELLAMVAMRDNDFDAMGRWLDQIVTDTEAPQAIKQRAEAFLGLVRSARKAK
jgi:hypothetical protein